MSHTTGIVYCALAASLYPDRVKGVFAMAAGIPIVDADKLKTLPRGTAHYGENRAFIAHCAEICHAVHRQIFFHQRGE